MNPGSLYFAINEENPYSQPLGQFDEKKGLWLFRVYIYMNNYKGWCIYIYGSYINIYIYIQLGNYGILGIKLPFRVSNWLFRVYRGWKLPSYVGIVMNHYKDPHEPTSISWKVGPVFYRGWFVVNTARFAIESSFFSIEAFISIMYHPLISQTNRYQTWRHISREYIQTTHSFWYFLLCWILGELLHSSN